MNFLYAKSIAVLMLLVALLIHCIMAEKPESHSQSTLDDIQVDSYLISLHDAAENSHFEGLASWLESKKVPIIEQVNESYIKFIVANMTKPLVDEIKKHTENYKIESIELDDLAWDSMDKPEL